MADSAVAEASTHPPHAKHHPTDLDYVKIAITLALLTAGEVSLSYSGLKGAALVIPLLVVMSIKFVMVASQFMHLRFDDKLLTRVFYAGLILAVAVYMAAMTTLRIWQR